MMRRGPRVPIRPCMLPLVHGSNYMYICSLAGVGRSKNRLILRCMDTQATLPVYRDFHPAMPHWDPFSALSIRPSLSTFSSSIAWMTLFYLPAHLRSSNRVVVVVAHVVEVVVSETPVPSIVLSLNLPVLLPFSIFSSIPLWSDGSCRGASDGNSWCLINPANTCPSSYVVVEVVVSETPSNSLG